MDYAVILHFDNESEDSIMKAMINVSKASLNNCMLDIGIRPHITLAVFKETNCAEFSKWLSSYSADTNMFNVQFSSIGIFPNNPSVLFLAPVIDEWFVKLHKNFYDKVKDAASGFNKYYLPGNLVPHCTLALRLSENELHNGLTTVINDFKPFTATVKQISLIQCNPFKELGTYNLGKEL